MTEPVLMSKLEENQTIRANLWHCLSDLKENPELSFSEMEDILKEMAKRHAKGLTFGTHTSKGNHSKSKGSTVLSLATEKLPFHLLSSRDIVTDNPYLDATGGASFLQLYTVLTYPVLTGTKTVLSTGEVIPFSKRLCDLILEDEDLTGVFSLDDEVNEEIWDAFHDCVFGVNMPEFVSDERNPQMYWLVADNGVARDYHLLHPLYPSALAHKLFLTINAIRFKPKDEKASEQENLFYINLATKQLGGDKPQNVGKLNSLQGGVNYLLPHLPPQQSFAFISPEDETLFNRYLAMNCKEEIKTLANTMNVEQDEQVKMRRHHAFLMIVNAVMQKMKYSHAKPKGWLKDHKLNEIEKVWLDPVDENQMANYQAISNAFFTWLLQEIQRKTKEYSTPNETEFDNWKSLFMIAIKG